MTDQITIQTSNGPVTVDPVAIGVVEPLGAPDGEYTHSARIPTETGMGVVNIDAATARVILLQRKKIAVGHAMVLTDLALAKLDAAYPPTS